MHTLLPPLDLHCFAADYREARRGFLERSEAFGHLPLFEHFAHRHPLPGPDGQPLYADWLLVSATPQPRRVLVLLSGTHGVEGLSGSALQCSLLENGLSELLEDPELGVLLIHALNPWGMAWLRRCDHEGIDLNRNFVDFQAGLPNNGAYSALHRYLEHDATDQDLAALPAGPVSRGQYQYPQGLYFGGHAPGWSRLWLESHRRHPVLAKAASIAVIDLHTGLGPFGYGEVINDHAPGSAGFEHARRWYGDNAMSTMLGESASAPKTGLIDYFWHRLIGDRGAFITLEFGTYAEQAMLRALLEEQRYFRTCEREGGTRSLEHPAVAKLKAFFYPTDNSWRQAVMLRSRQVVELALQGMLCKS